MRTVSCRSIAAIVEILESDAIPTHELLSGLGYDVSFLRAGREYISWQAGAVFFERLSRLVGGQRGLERVGERIFDTRVFSRVAVLLSELSDTAQLYRVVRFWLSPALAPGASRRMIERSDGSIELRSISDAPEPAEPYFFVLAGVLRVLPTLIGAPPAEVIVEQENHGGVYRIFPTPLPAAEIAERARSERALVATLALRELIDQQFDIQTTWMDHNRVIRSLSQRAQRTEVFSRLTQELAERLDLDALSRATLAVMIADFGFESAALQMIIPPEQPQLWHTGDRRGPPAITYPFTSGGQYRARLELWGDAEYEIGDENDPIAAFMPWLTLAFTNAVTFHNLNAERVRSEERLNALLKVREDITASEARYRLLVEEASDAIMVFSAATLRILEVNRSFCQLLDATAEELLEMRMHEVLEPDGHARVHEDLRQLLRGEVVRTTWVGVSTHGKRITLECSSKLIGDDRVQLIARDTAQWEAAQERIRESEERYVVAVRGAADGIWDWNLRTNELYLSERWKEMLAEEDQVFTTSPDEWLRRIHPEDKAAVQESIDRHILGENENISVEHRIQRGDGSWLWVHARGLALRDTAGNAYRMAGSLTDITQRKNFEKELYHAAFHDALTGLPNRAWSNDWLVNKLAQKTQPHFGLLYFDLDRFKIVNDSLGHIFGDEILREVAVRLKNRLPDGAYPVRIGGDEFVVLVENIQDPKELEELAQQVLALFAEPFKLDQQNFVLSCSIGITTSRNNHYERPEQMMRDADLAMYAAKNAGQGRVAFYTKALYTTALSKMQLEVSLRRAIENDELELWYQPIVHGATGTIVGAEGLARWPDGRPGGVAPDEFIPLAEESGLIHPLGRWAIERAARQYREWVDENPELAPLRISVNLSPQQFNRDDIVQHVEDVIQRYQIPPKGIVLEITEYALIEDSERSIERINALRNAGADVIIDDLGTGYSSLSYLVRLPIRFIKIDRSFVINIERDETRRKVATALVKLSASLDKHTVAEGVETEDARKILVEAAPEVLLQGYLFSPPVPAKKFHELLEQKQLP